MYGSLDRYGLLKNNDPLFSTGVLAYLGSLAQSVFMRISVRFVGSGFFGGRGALLSFGLLDFLDSLI